MAAVLGWRHKGKACAVKHTQLGHAGAKTLAHLHVDSACQVTVLVHEIAMAVLFRSPLPVPPERHITAVYRNTRHPSTSLHAMNIAQLHMRTAITKTRQLTN